ncbi:S8 family serine peptidase [Actinokineospora sp. G85]|uniref:RCC1 domain-containing protein n=1 Tax=Actinokineospora sp. G85 TaxID=3406626 RepID=UPI003C78A6B4
MGNNVTGQLGTGSTTSSSTPVRAVAAVNAWNTCHEDLAARPAPIERLHKTVGDPCLPPGAHGTGVVGIFAAQEDNGVGLNGLLPRAKLQLGTTNHPGVLSLARDHSTAGDIILLEVAVGDKVSSSPDVYHDYPWEVDAAVYDQVVLATAAGITVVEAAGNRGNDLGDLTRPYAATLMGRPDSGAIMVGAGEPPAQAGTMCTDPKPARSAASFTTYGSRVDVQAHGACIASLGTPSEKDFTPTETDPNKMYWKHMSGTSGAAPIVVGAAGAVQSIAKQSGTPLTPLQLRQLLKRTGNPQNPGETKHVGPQPDVKAAVADLRGGLGAGTAHTLTVKSDGSVWTWGSNSAGQLGNGSTTNSTTPVPVVGLAGVRRGEATVAGGAVHSLAVRSDGTAWAWGANTFGQLGNGTTTASTTPVQVSGLTGVVAVAAAGTYSLALKSDGTVWAWGTNANGQLGDGTTTQRTTPVQVSGVTGAVGIAAGSADHALAVKSDGTVRAWGANTHGQLGNGTTTASTTAVPVTGLTGVRSVSAGYAHSLAVRTNGTVASWGNNSNGQLGDGTTTQRTTPVAVSGLTDVASASASFVFSLAVRTNGTVASWGNNSDGQLGNGTTTSSTTPVTTTGVSATALASGSLHGVAAKSDGTLHTWGGNINGQLGDGTTTQRNTPVTSNQITLLRSRPNVALSSSHAIVATSDGRVIAWGLNNAGQLGNGGSTDSTTPVTVRGISNAATTPDAVAVGQSHSLALLSNGTVLAWGANPSGQLGDGTTGNRLTPVKVGNLTGVVAVAASGSHSLALKSDGTVWAWGLNSAGQLGDGSTTSRSTPVQVSGLTGVARIATGPNGTSLAVRTDGTLRAWGANTNGEYGNGTTTAALTPVSTGLTGLSTQPGAVAVGATFATAVKANGTVVSWGANADGQLGNGTTTASLTPVTVTGVSTAVAVSAGSNHALALLRTGQTSAWGGNAQGQLGDGTTTPRPTPVTVTGLTGLTEVTAGLTTSAASRADGSVRTWGRNTNGQLGNGTTTASATPVLVSGTG